MARFVLLLLLANLISVGYGLSCYECSTIVAKFNGIILGEAEVKACVKKTCDKGATKCVSGYAEIFYTGDLFGAKAEVEVTVDYFKGCGFGSLSTCDSLSGFLSDPAKVGSDAAEVKNCKMEDCTTDNCNTKTPEEINPNILKKISCYSCGKYTANGKGDPAKPDQPECMSKEHKETCNLGVETCFAGNFAATMDGTTHAMEYGKGCGESLLNCGIIKTGLEDKGGVLDSCNLKSCEGDLCNTQSADETKKIRGAAGHNFLSTALAAATAFYIFM